MQLTRLDAATVLRELAATAVRHSPRLAISRAAASTLSILEREGAQRITTLAEREAVSQPAMTNLVQRLEANRLVTRAPDPEDARASLISITDEGASTLTRRRHVQNENLRATLDRLSPADRAAIDAALPALIAFTELHESR